MYEKPFKARYSTTETSGGTRVVIPTRRNVFIILFLCAWLGAWFFGETHAIKGVVNPKTGEVQWFLLFWLAGWTLGGLWALGCVLWQLAGKEILEAVPGALRHRIEIAGIGVTRNYATNDIRDFRLSAIPQGNRWTQQQQVFPPFFSAEYGPISFDYGARTLRVGSGLDEAEAKGVIEYLHSKFPSNVFTRSD